LVLSGIVSKDASPPGGRVIATGKYLTFIERDGWEFVTRSGASGVVVLVAFTDAGKLLLVEQPRPALGRRVVELPAGLVGDEAGRRGEGLADAARRELAEETGYEAREMVQLAEGPVAVGVSDEVVTFFHAKGLLRVGPGGGDATEDITVFEVAPSELAAFLRDKARAGLAVDPKIYAGLYLVETAGRAGSAGAP
jgi:ADP-ribose pyrophosphatase